MSKNILIKDLIDSFESDEKNKGRRYREFLYHCFMKFEDEIKKITDELSNNFKSQIKLNYIQDESLIGGLVVQVGSTMIDTSIKSKLQQIENRMIEA